MARLADILDSIISGKGRMVMLVGEPGIGKTRTAVEFAKLAEDQEIEVLWGRCYEGEGAPSPSEGRESARTCPRATRIPMMEAWSAAPRPS